MLNFFLLFSKESLGAIDVKLSLEPSTVEINESSVLRCQYDLGNASLYSVKWYRGAHEFYRYTPREHPDTKVFPFGGIHIDLHKSNSTQVVLTNIDFVMSGNFTCEVTTDGAPVNTGTDSKAMLVVELPQFPPHISVSKDPLDYGDILRANCTSHASRPPAVLKFYLNNITVARAVPQRAQEKNWSDLMLEMQLSDYHFVDGRLRLRCTAQVADIYYKEAVLELESARHPVPERVSADSSSNAISTYSIVVQLLLVLFNYLFLFHDS